jgi:aryl-alcohol dehydrogenase-like predicted oxidoreductase
MFHRRRVESELAPIAEAFGIGLTTWSPLASGILTGKYNEGIPAGSRASMESMAWIKDSITQERIAKVVQLKDVADELGITNAQLAIAWLLRRKEVSSVITGATKLAQLKDNLAAREAVANLDDNILEKIEKILQNDPLNHD